MDNKDGSEALERRIRELEKQSAQQKRASEINRALFSISGAVNTAADMGELFRTIHHALSPVIDTTNFYIARYDRDTDSLTFPYCIDTVDECYPTVLAASRTESLTARVIRTGRPLMVTKEEILADRAASGRIIPACTPAELWLGAPLKTPEGVIGVIAVQSYEDPMRYDRTDMEVLVSVADQVALAIARRKSDEALRESEEIFRQFMDHSPIFVFFKDEHIRSIRLSRNYEKMLGKPLDELIGKNMDDLFPSDLAKSMIADDMRILKEGKPITIEEELDGRLYSTIKFPIIKGGRPRYLAGYTMDITERKRAEEALKKSEERFRLTFLTSPDAININRLEDGMYVDVNQSFLQMTGYSREEVIGKTSLEINIWHDPEDRRELVRGLKEKSYYTNLETMFRLKDGSLRSGLMSARVIVLNDSPHILSITRDISELKHAVAEQEKLHAQLMQSQKMESVGRLAGGVAHDFNNMLTVILGHVEMLLEQTGPEQPAYAKLASIRKAAASSADLTRQLLAFARKQTIAPKVLDLNVTVEGMLKMLRRLIGEDIDLSWQPKSGLWPIHVDPAQVDQILANLCVNARDAIAGVGQVTIETDNVSFDRAYCDDHPGFVPGRFAMLAVIDDGSGMGKETLALIFEPFFTTKGVGQGTGLGLATVYGIVKQNNGFIDVFSELDHGSTFRVYFPQHAGETLPAHPEGSGDAIRRGHEIVLLVEDDSEILKLGKLMLEQLGYGVMVAGTPGEAVHLAETHSGEIHLLITDVVMPDMNGRDLAMHLQSAHPGLKCLFMSGYTANVIAHHGVLDPEVLFIQKPFSMKDLSAKVREALE